MVNVGKYTSPMDAMGYEFVSLLESLGVFDTELVAKGGLHETASEVEGPEELPFFGRDQTMQTFRGSILSE